jgi:hypothetical protein
MPVIKSKLQEKAGEKPVESQWKSGDKFRRTIVDGKGFVNCAPRPRRRKSGRKKQEISGRYPIFGSDLSAPLFSLEPEISICAWSGLWL